MKLKINHILHQLEPLEKRQFRLIVWLDVLNTLADLFFLTALIILIEMYTKGTARFALLSYFATHVHFIIISGTFFLFFCLKNRVSYLFYTRQYQFFYDVATRISRERLIQYFKGGYNNYVSTDSSVHIKKISQQPVEFAHYVLSGAQQVISQSVLIFLTAVVLVIWKPVLFILVAMLMIPGVFLVSRSVKRKLYDVRTRSKKASEESLQNLQQALGAFVESNLYGKREYFTNRYFRKQKALNDCLAAIQTTQALPSKTMEACAIGGFFVVVTVNTWLGQTAELVTVGAFLAAAYKIIPGVVKIVNALAHFRTYGYTMDGNKTFTPERDPDLCIPIRSFSFRNVGFSYDGRKLLDEVNFDIRPGDFVLLKGISGKGKSSMLNVLLGFLSPGSGTILINDREVDAVGLRAYWSRIAYNKQEPFIFYDSLEENICLGDMQPARMHAVLNATGIRTEGGVWTAGKGNMPDLAENGRNISGGQKQRVALARTFYRDADLYIFDESFSELDESAEGELIEHCAALAQKGKMILLVSHNPAATQVCNKIIEL